MVKNEFLNIADHCAGCSSAFPSRYQPLCTLASVLVSADFGQLLCPDEKSQRLNKAAHGENPVGHTGDN